MNFAPKFCRSLISYCFIAVYPYFSPSLLCTFELCARNRNRLRDKELTEHIRKLVVQFEDQNFETEGHSVLISDEYHDACYVYGFRVNEDVLYALLDYDDGRLRTVPVSDLCVVELFDAFWLLVQNA